MKARAQRNLHLFRRLNADSQASRPVEKGNQDCPVSSLLIMLIVIVICLGLAWGLFGMGSGPERDWNVVYENYRIDLEAYRSNNQS